MKLLFWGGPLDGLTFDSALIPPETFYLPTPQELVVSVYEFRSVRRKGEMTYTFTGYRTVTKEEEALLLSASY